MSDDKELQKIDSSLKRVIGSLNTRHEKDRKDKSRVLIRKASEMDMNPQFISTGIQALDNALGGGVCKEGITVLHGQYFTGKTAAAISIIAGETKKKNYCLYVYTETPPPWSLIKELGVDLDYLYMIGPQDYAEQMIDAIENILWDKDARKPRGLISVFVLDSIQNFVGKKEVDKLDKEGAEGQNMAVRALLLDNLIRRLMGRGLLVGEDGSGGVAGIFIGQNRANMDPNSPVKDELAGGFAVKYGPKMIIGLRKKSLGGDKKLMGHTVMVKVTKNAIIGRPSETDYTVMYGKGVDDTEGLVAKATEWGYIIPDPTMPRGWMRVILPTLMKEGDVQIKGKASLVPVLRDLPEIKTILKDLLGEGKPKTAPVINEAVRLSIDPAAIKKAAEAAAGNEEE